MKFWLRWRQPRVTLSALRTDTSLDAVWQECAGYMYRGVFEVARRHGGLKLMQVLVEASDRSPLGLMELLEAHCPGGADEAMTLAETYQKLQHERENAAIKAKSH